jgi:crotonobetainyl-CoA:carnitine CoA-transferase CaiB-like acyl-CoA transferase
VLVHNFRKGVMEKLGFGYDQVRPLHPGLIYAWSSGWGDHGPSADRGRGGHDMMARAEGGWFVQYDPEKPPIPGGISIDYAAGLNLMIGILTALYHRHRTGQGQFVSTDLLSTAFHAHAWEGAAELNRERITRPAAVGGTEEAVDKAFATKDGFIEISPVFSDNALRDISLAVGLNDLSQDARFSTESLQIENRTELNALLATGFQTRTTAEWMEKLEAQGVFCAEVRSFGEAMKDPQIQANNMVVSMYDAGGKPLRMLGTPVRLHETPPCLKRFPPKLGRDNAAVAEEIGLTADEIDELMQKNVLSGDGEA